MPVYEYQGTDPAAACALCRERFEVRQAMADEPLRNCPQCRGPVQKLVSLCAVSTAASVRAMLSDRNLKEKGFNKLVNEGGGKFRRTV